MYATMESAKRALGVIVFGLLVTMTVSALTAEPAEAGAKAFRKYQACPSLDAGVNKKGPSLHGVFGRPVGSLEDYAFSNAIKQSDRTWVEAPLDAFVADPAAAVPGNKMFFSSLRSEKNRKAVVANSKSNTDLGGTIDGIVNPELLTGDGNFVQLLLPDAERADAEEWWNAVPGFEQFGANKPLSREQRRTANQRARDVLAARVAPEFEADPRLLSQQTLRALGIAINRYQAIVAAGGWPTIPDKVTLRLNDSGENVSKVRRHLLLAGDLPAETGQGWSFDIGLETALARYQLRHGLRVTGFVDRRTLLALNVSAAERLAQLRYNLTRVAKLMKLNEAERVVMVNVPAYRLEALERGQLALRSRVVVGRPGRETPEVSAKIIEVNFYPYWRVPDSIARKDLIPQIRKDTSYFQRKHFSVMRTWGAQPLDPAYVNWRSPDVWNYKFRQDPGAFNALGVVRINMPNKHTVYLHDTPLKQLFGQSARAFSSGCVRVERVLDLVEWLLRGEQGWSSDKIQAALKLQLRENVQLKKAVPVHFIYVTAWASPNGAAHFRQDIYSRDGLMAVSGHDLDDDAPQITSITP